MSSIFGKVFQVSTFGESHGKALGVIIDGCPANIPLCHGLIQKQVNRRRPGQSGITSPRNEPDKIICLSGEENYRTLGSPLTFMVMNKDQKPEEYKKNNHIFRNSHADFTTYQKYGIMASSGGGRSSAREAVARTIAGSVAHQMLSHFLPAIRILAFVSRVGPIVAATNELVADEQLQPDQIDAHPTRCPDQAVQTAMLEYIEELMTRGDTIGGEITCVIRGLPPGLGEPVFDKLNSDLAKAMMSIPAARYFHQGNGYESTYHQGSENNDPLSVETNTGNIIYTTNKAGGIEGGISTGAPIFFQVGFKPPSSIQHQQSSVTKQGIPSTYSLKGRYDPCVLPRAAPIVESMACLVLADHYLRQKIQSWIPFKESRS
ncbi:MAG: chorismate synthase [Proteobacteria bacterium]|nr:chorismate synthase [Pseudomonadota bacterium]